MSKSGRSGFSGLAEQVSIEPKDPVLREITHTKIRDIVSAVPGRDSKACPLRKFRSPPTHPCVQVPELLKPIMRCSGPTRPDHCRVTVVCCFGPGHIPAE